jgi:hypothetical protein
VTEHVNQRELAARLGLTTRQVRNLANDGLPRNIAQGVASYPWPEALNWYIARRIKQAAPPDKLAAQTRKLQAEAMLAELALAREQQAVVPIETCDKLGADMADALRAVLINLPSSHALALERLGVSAEEAERVLHEIADELITSLRWAVENAA